MNTIYDIKLPLVICVTALLCGCGQSGKLFLPGHGSGYYRTHRFTQRPTSAAATVIKSNPTSQ